MVIKDYWTGMKEWRVRQELYHRLNKEYSDDLNNVDIVWTEDVVNEAVRHFYERIDQWIYPSKSYFVAICYASWLSEDFDEDFFDLLNDPMLLAGNDPYFKPYNLDSEIYDSILKHVSLPLPMTGMVEDVRSYYEEEFGIRT